MQCSTHKALRQTVIKQESNEDGGGEGVLNTYKIYKHFRGSLVVVTSFFELGGGGRFE